MQRGSEKHSPRQDEALKAELDGELKGDKPSRAETWREPEPPADDDPDVPPFQPRDEPE